MVRLIRQTAILLVVTGSYTACGSPRDQPAPAPQSESTEVASGPQRIEWDQSALDGTDVASYRFILHIDGTEKELTAKCGELLQSGNHLCSAELPALSAGRHVIAVAAFHEKDGKRFESRPSVSLTLDAR